VEETQFLDFFRPQGIPYAVFILLATFFIGRLVSNASEALGDRFGDRRLAINLLASLTRFTFYVVGIGGAVAVLFRLTPSVILAASGTIALAVGFALKDLASSVIAGLIILIDRPFQVGDRVTFDGYYGEISHIGLRSVRLVTLDDTQVTIPNNRFLTDSVASGNAGAIDMMVQVDLFIGADQPIGEAKRIVGEVLTTSRFVHPEKTWAVVVTQIIQDSYVTVRLRAKAYVLDVRFESAFATDVTERSLRELAAAGIAPPAMLHRNSLVVSPGP